MLNILVSPVTITQIVVTGSSRTSTSRTSTSHTAPDTSSKESIPVGAFVAVYMDQYRDEIPTIGKVLSKTADEVEVEWWFGTYTKVWKCCKRREGKEYVPWIELVPAASVLMPVTLTKSSYLSKATVQHLKDAYTPYL